MASQMEIDSDAHLPPLFDNGSSGTLKRCSSAPMINMLVDNLTVSSLKQSRDDSTKSTNSMNSQGLLSFSSTSEFKPFDSSRTRTRHSSTSSVLQSSPNCSGVSTPIKIPSRIHEIKREAEVHRNREIRHERELQSSMQLSQSWGDNFSLDDPLPPVELANQKARPRSLSESLHIFTTGFPVSSSPSPTRVGKQCFSPSMQAPVMFNGHNFNLTPSPSPSPTRRVARRSLSPIVTLKPSSLSQKRKLDTDSDSGFSQPKRIFTGSLLAPASLSLSPSTLTAQHQPCSLRSLETLRQQSHSSLSAGSFDDSASEHSSTGNLNGMASSTISNPFGFTPLATAGSSSSTTTDSESEMCEPTPSINNNSTSLSNR